MISKNKPTFNISVRLHNVLEGAANPNLNQVTMALMKDGKPDILEIVKNAESIHKIIGLGAGCLDQICEYISLYASREDCRSWRKKLTQMLRGKTGAAMMQQYHPVLQKWGYKYKREIPTNKLAKSKIAGRSYISHESIRRFEARAAAGDFSKI